MRLGDEEWRILLRAASDKNMTEAQFIEFAGQQYNCNLTTAVRRAMLVHFFEKANRAES